ncbi:MAG: flavin reductase [Sphingomonadaceae bacterium]|nr:flavin reductase [Sphingomonadaceae bacterium]
MTHDPRQFRAALGSFPTGVTIVTTLDNAGEPVGVTASSFNSVSLDPPLVLWSVAKSSKSLDAFCSSGHFAIHVLSAGQEDMSNRFARSGEDKFGGVDWRKGEAGSPVLGEYAALFECRTMHQYEGGDHVILVGEVLSFDQSEAPPLVFHGGRYAETRSRPDGQGDETVDIEHGRFTDDFLFYLLSRAHFQASRPARETYEAMRIGQTEYLVLSVLSMASPASPQTIAERLEHTGLCTGPDMLAAMEEDGWLVSDAEGYSLAPRGRECLVRTLSVAKAFETDLLDQLTPGEIHEAKRLLKKIIDLTGPDIPIGWRGSDNRA